MQASVRFPFIHRQANASRPRKALHVPAVMDDNVTLKIIHIINYPRRLRRRREREAARRPKPVSAPPAYESPAARAHAARLYLSLTAVEGAAFVPFAYSLLSSGNPILAAVFSGGAAYLIRWQAGGFIRQIWNAKMEEQQKHDGLI